MATYEVKGPDGATYKVEGPDGATDAQIIDAVKAQIAGEEKVEEPTLPQSGIYAGVERDVSTSDASLPDEAVAEQSVGARFVEKVNDYDPTKDEGVAQELFEGIASGVIGIGQGIGELGASAVDVVADTDYSTAVTKGAQELREELGIDPVGLVGKGAEIITQFVVPGAVAVGTVSKLGKTGKFLNYLSGKIGGKTTAFSPTKLGRLSEAARKGKAGKLVGADGKLTRGQKFALLGQEAAALGVAEFAVATDGITTIGDFFEGGPTQTDREVGLSGREEALRKIGNKFLSAVEVTGIGIVAPPVLSVIGSTASTTLRVDPRDLGKVAVAKATGKTVPAKDIRPGIAPVAARFALDKAGKVGSYFDELENARKGGQALTKPKAFLADLLAGLRYRGYLPEEAAEVRALIEGMTEADIKTATVTLNRIEQNLNDKVLSKYASKGADDTDLARQSFFNKVEDFMTAPTKEARTTAFQNLPDWARTDVSSMRQQVDNLSKDLLESDFIKKMDGVLGPDGKKTLGQSAREAINRNLNSYLRRRYRAFEDAKYKVSDENLAIGIEGFKKNKSDTVHELVKILKQAENPVSPLYKLDNGKPMFTEKSLGIMKNDKGKYVLTKKNATDEQARLAAENFLGRKTLKNRTNLSGTMLGRSSRAQEFSLDPKLFLSRSNIKDYQRALLGEIKDPKEQFLGTIADISQFKAVDKYFGRIRQLATETTTDAKGKIIKKNPGIAKLFRDLDAEGITTQAQREQIEKQGYKILGGAADKKNPLLSSTWGSLEGFAVPEAIYGDMTRLVLSDDGLIPNIIRYTYGNFLKAKGASQYAKTVLAPTTQVRNVTTASLFAAMQGNIGRGANLEESIRLVFNDIKKLPEKQAAEQLAELQRLGVIGSQAELKEIKSLISQGVGVDAKRGARQFGNKWTDNQLGAFVSKTGKFAENLYQGGDNVWKIYNYTFELNKLKNALGKAPVEEQIEFLSKGRGLREGQTVETLFKEEAARIVRDTVPNYNLAPKIIKQLRGLPTGNFIAFPAEIVRTGTNSIARALEEMASNSAEIQKIGLRRMTGIIGTTYAAPTALYTMAQEITGITDEQMAALKRSLVPEWEKNALLIPTGRDEHGRIKYVNYSYSNPYDLVGKIAQAALNDFEANQRRGKDIGTSVALGTFGALEEFFTPFLGESMMMEALTDVTVRQGERKSGVSVYNKEESAGEIASKSFAHVFNTLLPSAFPGKLKGTTSFEALPITIAPSDSIRGLVAALDVENLSDISVKDRQGLEVDYTKELSGALSGIVENSLDVPTGLMFKGYEFGKSRSRSQGILNSVARQKNVRASDIINAYKSANEARFRSYNEMRNVVLDMRTAGLDDIAIEEALQKAKVGDIGAIMEGEYIPMKLSDEMKKNIDENDNFDKLDQAMDVLDSYIDEQYDRKYTVAEDAEVNDPREEPSTSNLGPLSQAPQTTQPVAATTPPPVVAQAGPATAPSAGPAPASMANAITLPNPQDQLLAARLRGQ